MIMRLIDRDRETYCWQIWRAHRGRMVCWKIWSWSHRVSDAKGYQSRNVSQAARDVWLNCGGEYWSGQVAGEGSFRGIHGPEARLNGFQEKREHQASRSRENAPEVWRQVIEEKLGGIWRGSREGFFENRGHIWKQTERESLKTHTHT